MKNQELFEKICDIKFLDAHSHVDSRHVSARGLHDVLLYHMVISDLYCGGCPDGARLSEMPDDDEAYYRLERAIPYVKNIRNTSCYWGVRTILKDLYGITEEVDESNWKKIDAAIRERAGDPAWEREILSRAGIQKVMTEYARRGKNADDILEYSQEWSFFTRAQWGRQDAALLELEHAWNCPEASSPIPVKASDDDVKFAKKIKNVDDVKAALKHYCDKTPEDLCTTNASHLSTDIHFGRKVTDEEMNKAIANRANAGPEERDIYANYIQNAYMDMLDERGSKIILQFSLGAEPLPFETGSILHQETGFEIAKMMSEHPNRMFLFHVANEALDQQFCTICRELPNAGLVGYWWHNFFPPMIRKVMSDRMDMLAANKTIGFFSDAYCVDWLYAKSRIVRTQFADVLGQRIEMGQYTEQVALDYVKTICYDSPINILGMKPNTNL